MDWASSLNLISADAWDVWPLDDGSGFVIVIFISGFCANIRDHYGTLVFQTVENAEKFFTDRVLDVPRFSHPGPLIPKQ